jgi:predicted thioesterase
MSIEIGLKGSAEQVVTHELTAAAVGSGAQEVFATPAMIAMMEMASLSSLIPYLEPGQGSVGTRVSISHLSATPIGMTVRAESEIIEIDRKRIVFSVKAYDEAGLIGEGTHERFIIDVEKFMAKNAEKKPAASRE